MRSFRRPLLRCFQTRDVQSFSPTKLDRMDRDHRKFRSDRTLVSIGSRSSDRKISYRNDPYRWISHRKDRRTRRRKRSADRRNASHRVGISIESSCLMIRSLSRKHGKGFVEGVAMFPCRAASFWSQVPEAPKDPILNITERFLADEDPNKMNLGVGAYRSDEGKPVVLDCVREAEKRIAGNEYMEYLPIGGSKPFVDLSLKLCFGENSRVIEEKSIAAVQSLSGTGSCRLMADFMHRFKPGAIMFMPKPTWANHHNIWRDAGVRFQDYRYYDPTTKGLDIDGLLEDVSNAPQGSFFLLHACAHNPTGVDPDESQWGQISKLMKEKGHFPFFDMAYQGFASGDCVKDAKSISIFLNDGHDLGCSQSYAKNMGLYGQRIGCFSITCQDPEEAKRVESQMKRIARPTYSSPPIHGAKLVSTVLGDERLKAQWYEEVKGMASRIIDMRTMLRDALESEGSKLSWRHVTDQIGMFCYSGLTPEQVERLETDHHVYMTKDGRISMAGVTSKNVGPLAKAIHMVTTK